MDQEETAKFGYRSAIGHLPDNLSGHAAIQTLGENQRFDLFMLLAISCTISIAQSDKGLILRK